MPKWKFNKSQEVEVTNWTPQQIFEKVKEWTGHDVTWVTNINDAKAVIYDYRSPETKGSIYIWSDNCVGDQRELIRADGQMWLFGDPPERIHHGRPKILYIGYLNQ
jgi:hypothetical protein